MQLLTMAFTVGTFIIKKYIRVVHDYVLFINVRMYIVVLTFFFKHIVYISVKKCHMLLSIKHSKFLKSENGLNYLIIVIANNFFKN